MSSQVAVWCFAESTTLNVKSKPTEDNKLIDEYIYSKIIDLDYNYICLIVFYVVLSTIMIIYLF